MRGTIRLVVILGVFYGIYWSMNEYHEPDAYLGHQFLQKYLVYMQEAEEKGDTKEYKRLIDNSELYLLRCWRTGESIMDRILGEPKGLAWMKHPDCREITARWFRSYQKDLLVEQGHRGVGW